MIGHDIIMGMNIKFSDIKVLIWDFDGTLYKQIPALLDNIRDTEIQVIVEHTGWNEKKAKEEFYKVYGVTTPSGTTAVSQITHIPHAQSSRETSALTNYKKFLHAEPRLPQLFDTLTQYRHFMLVNGSQESVSQGLALLQLDKNIFEEIITSEVVGETKPSTKGFLYILNKTGLPPGEHCMIGDREMVDLAPAKMLGMKTCLVWQEAESTVADVTVKTVYDVSSIL